MRRLYAFLMSTPTILRYGSKTKARFCRPLEDADFVHAVAPGVTVEEIVALVHI
jgi:hypothetical protein